MTFQCCYRPTEPVLFTLQFNYYSCCIQNYPPKIRVCPNYDRLLAAIAFCWRSFASRRMTFTSCATSWRQINSSSLKSWTPFVTSSNMLRSASLIAAIEASQPKKYRQAQTITATITRASLIRTLFRLRFRVSAIEEKGYDLFEWFLADVNGAVDPIGRLNPIHFTGVTFQP